MPNFKTLFPANTSFGTNSGDVAAWAEGDSTALIPTDKLESINIGNTFAFTSTETVEADALTEFYAVTTNQYHKGDIAVITYNTNDIVTLLYTGTNQTTAGASTASDWSTIGGSTTGVTGVTGGNAIHASASTGSVTLSNDLKFSKDDGTSVPAAGTYITRVNFTGAGVTVNADSTNADVVDVDIDPEVAYTINTTPGADTNINLVKNTVQVLPVATSARTFTLPQAGSGDAQVAAGDWIKIVNLTGRTDTTIARNGSPIQSETTDLILDDATANFELVYIDATYGWAVIGAN